MFSIHTDKHTNLNYNIVYSNKQIKSNLINNKKYIKYNKIDKSLAINNELSTIDNMNKSINYYALNEIISKLKIFNEYKNSLILNFDNIIINEINDNVLIISFEYNLNIKKVIENILNIVKIIELDNYIIINYVDLFFNNNIELLIILSKLFKKIKIFYCKTLKQNILIGYNYIHNNLIILLFKNIIKKWKKNYYIKTFNIDINNIQNKILIYNEFIFNYFLNINLNIYNLESSNEKEHVFNHFLKIYKLIPFEFNCNHCLMYSEIKKHFICKKCFELFNLF